MDHVIKHKWEMTAAVIAGVTCVVLLARQRQPKKAKKVATPNDAKKEYTATQYAPSAFSLSSIPQLAGKVAVVTGANSGIGFETAKHLALNGAKVTSQHNPAFTGGNYYGQSKLANILFATSLNKAYGYQIAVNSVHPGFVSTELIRPDPFTPLWFAMKIFPRSLLTRLMVGSSQGALSPEQGAFASLYAATHPEILEKGIKGKYIIPFGVVSDDHHPLAMDPEHAQKLWDFSEAVCSKY
ncbi:hypothetical protein HDU79_005905 [Rhizoclosmatium sp. JEL0117]|nr:hypothetical protein HDU79_005905 [Rhizoclosmatium sp. JEL0117]